MSIVMAEGRIVYIYYPEFAQTTGRVGARKPFPLPFKV